MDRTDRKILIALQQERQNTKEIAAKVGLSVTPTYERIKKLEQQGIIKGYVALLDREKIGKRVVAYCQVTLLKHQKGLINTFEQEIQTFPEIMECHHVSGGFDFLLKIAVSDIKEFHQFINEKLSVLEGISNIHSSFVMNSVKESTAYKL
ncbi:Lrp/AsnC family transcriptional regulator [Robertkochia marina]|uniref:Lrp/AsnC family transcriptional regulator n=2 Tax=Robertkochia marina TaxID=1227945 RepID=A0A4S3LZV6_9FLAO|nr:Lrp/AsnC family transcriptional regulator [Robertkochia marina]TRZ45692.1 Lrp/AsnC family transcriptional regulator [Robertkochia marina]